MGTEYNLITHAYRPDENVSQILNMDATGQMFNEEYVSDRIAEKISLWSAMELNNKMYMSGNTKQTVKVRDKNIDLKETKDLYGRFDGPSPLQHGYQSEGSNWQLGVYTNTKDLLRPK